MPQVDRIAGLTGTLGVKAPVRVASTANLTLSGLQTIDGIAVADKERVLAAGQTNPIDNGIWEASAGAWTRAPDFDGARDVVGGTRVAAAEGTVYAGREFRVTTTGDITPGTTAISFLPIPHVEPGTINVQSYGALGDGVTDDYAAFAAAYADAAVQRRALFIPSLPTGKYYKLSQALNITHQDFVLYGEGVGSLLCAFNATGLNAITVRARHVTIRDIGVTGTANSGHGIQLGLVGTPAHFAHLSNIWIGWMGGNCLEIVEAISSTYDHVIADMDNGYRPATLIGASEGGRLHGFNIHRSATGINNDQKFIGCTLNSACNATGTELRVGVDGAGTFEMFEWNGGLIQGQPVGAKLIHLNSANRCNFNGGDYEPNGGVTGTFTIANSNYVHFEDALMQGDLTFTNSPYASIRDCTVNAISFDATSTNAVVEHTVYGSTGGKITDLTGSAVLNQLINSSSLLHHAGNRLAKGFGAVLFDERMEYWNGGGVPTVPSHLHLFTGAVTREPTTKLTGKYSLKLVAGAATDKVTCVVDVSGAREVLIEAWVYNSATTGNARITGVNLDSGADSTITSVTNDTWERIQATFTPAAGCNSMRFDFGVGAPGTVYWDSIKVVVPSMPEVKEKTLASSATPALSSDGITIKSFVTGDATTITNFTYPIVGEPFVIRFAHAKTIANNANIALKGGEDFVGAVGDTLTLQYGTDGVFREVARTSSTGPCRFSAYLSATAANVSGDGTVYPIVCDTEIFDLGGNYNNATGVFTAGVTGQHRFNIMARIGGLVAATHSVVLQLVTTSRTYEISDGPVAQTAESYSRTVLADMTAGDTAYLSATVSGGAKTADITGGVLNYTTFQGELA